jgi:hypothetical protein
MKREGGVTWLGLTYVRLSCVFSVLRAKRNIGREKSFCFMKTRLLFSVSSLAFCSTSLCSYPQMCSR